jgi:proteic killer suppression protein
MLIRNFLHKGLERLYKDDQSKGLPAASADKLRKMLFFLLAMSAESELRSPSVWKAHQLSGQRKGTWSLHVTANWRLTFQIEGDEICNVTLEDYH